MFTLALVRFPPTATKEIQYLNAKGALTYTDIAGSDVMYGFFFSSRRRHTRCSRDWSSDVCSSDLRVAREVGTEGKLGGQAAVPGVAGTWKDLTDSVNSMAGNLTAQVRNISEVATADRKSVV